MKYYLIILLGLLFFVSCDKTLHKENVVDEQKNLRDTSSSILANTAKKEEASFNWKDYWKKPDQKAILLKNPKVHWLIKECLKDTAIVVMTKPLLEYLEMYSEIKSLGDINNDGINDSIMVIPELIKYPNGSIEEGGRSVVFTDKTIPRIQIDVPCIHPEYIFPVADIDNDGTFELGKYYSSCASRFKGLDLITLQNGIWEYKGHVTFDTMFETPKMEERIEKTGANTYRMREIMEARLDEKKDVWIDFKMN